MGVGAGVEASLVDCGRASGVGDTVASRTMGMDAAMPCVLVLQPLSAVGNQKDYYHLWKIKTDHYHLVGNRNGYLSQWEIKIIINQWKIKMDNYHTLWEINKETVKSFFPQFYNSRPPAPPHFTGDHPSPRSKIKVMTEVQWTCGSHQPVDSFCRPCVSGCPSAPPPPPHP